MTRWDWAALGCLLYFGWEIGYLRIRVKALEEILKEPLEYAALARKGAATQKAKESR